VKQNERGFTLVEVVAVIAISAAIAGAAALGVFQVVKGAERSNEHIAAVDQVRNAGYWVSSDAQRAQKLVVDGLTPPKFLIVSWTEWNSDDKHEITYTLENMPSTGLRQLQRSESINEGAPITTVVAKYIDPDPAKSSCVIIEDRLILTITAAVSLGSQTKSETRIFEIMPRPD